MFQYNLQDYLHSYKDYLELRVQDNRTKYIHLVNGNVANNSINSKKGVSARAYINGSWGFASSTDITDESIKSIIIKATRNSSFLNLKCNKSEKRFNPTTPKISKSFATKKNKLSDKQKIDYLKELDNFLAIKYPKLKSREVILSTLDTEKKLVTTDGASLYTMIPRSIIYVNLVIEKDNNPYELYIPFYGLGEFEDNFNNVENMYQQIEENYIHLVRKSEGVYPVAGYKECILDSKLAGILAHEAIGHTTEADLVMSGSIAAQYLNREIASPLISIVDFAHSMNGENCPVPIYIDDEGTEAKDVSIIDNGILRSFMHNKESARKFGVEPKGNARAYDFYDEPLIRMRNTAILPGKSSLNDMISSIEDGYYLIKSSNGQADSTSEFMFGVVLGYEIKNGKITKGIKDTTISGVATEVLQSVTMVSNDMQWSMGNCGKKQIASVGMGGPAIKCKINLGGR